MYFNFVENIFDGFHKTNKSYETPNASKMTLQFCGKHLWWFSQNKQVIWDAKCVKNDIAIFCCAHQLYLYKHRNSIIIPYKYIMIHLLQGIEPWTLRLLIHT